MPKITITFQEEGDQPTVVEIPEQIAAVLQQHVQMLQAEGVPVSGKTDMFVRFTWQNWLKPVLERHGVTVRSLSGSIGEQILQLEQQLAQLRALEEYAAIQSVIHISQPEP